MVYTLYRIRCKKICSFRGMPAKIGSSLTPHACYGDVLKQHTSNVTVIANIAPVLMNTVMLTVPVCHVFMGCQVSVTGFIADYIQL